jgi:hypothetical protein
MGNTVRHDDDVALGDLPGLSVADAASTEFVRRGGFRVDGFATRDEGGRPI